MKKLLLAFLATLSISSASNAKVPLLSMYDVNLDGIVNVSDITALVNYITGESYSGNPDVNGDGIVNIADISALINHLIEGPESGNLYFGMTAFNQSVSAFPMTLINDTSITEVGSFIDGLSTRPGSLLYYSVDAALDALHAGTYPSDLYNATLVTFSAGLDQGSFMMDTDYLTEQEYIQHLRQRISTEMVGDAPLTAYSIGLKSGAIIDDDLFSQNIQALASSSDNAKEAATIEDVDKLLQKLAAKLSNDNIVYSLNLKMVGLSHGTKVRFTFDNVDDATKSEIYIEGTFDLRNKALTNLDFKGLNFSGGTTLAGTVDGIFINLSFEGITTEDLVPLSTSYTKEWTYVASKSLWQNYADFNKDTDVASESKTMPSAVMFVMDCSKAVESNLPALKSAAKRFISRLNADTSNDPGFTSADEWHDYLANIYRWLLNCYPSVSDGGAGSWMRCHWNLQELTADEALVSRKWNDPGYESLNMNRFLPTNEWIYAAYYDELMLATETSEFISKSNYAYYCGLSEEEINPMIAECRVLRAYAYYYMIDLFGRGPWIDENTVNRAPAVIYDRAQLFDATVEELLDVINSGDLIPASEQEYGRLSLEAARMLLAKLYLNAEVYRGIPMYDKCAEQCKEILKTINTLAPEYKYLFCADNDQYVGNGEIIWAIPQQSGSIQTETWGGTTYLTAGAYIESVPQEVLMSLGAVRGGTVWSGLRIRPELSQNLEDNGGKRNLVYAGSFNRDIYDLLSYDVNSDGYMCIKYTYTTSDDYYNNSWSWGSTQVCDTDYPVFRLADTYLMLTECQLRGVAGADPGYAYFNKVRMRAGCPVVQYLSLNELLAERQRELYWEGHRRSDLIRFHKYTGDSYIWQWKGGMQQGASIPSYYELFPIPNYYANIVGQNPGYEYQPSENPTITLSTSLNPDEPFVLTNDGTIELFWNKPEMYSDSYIYYIEVSLDENFVEDKTARLKTSYDYRNINPAYVSTKEIMVAINQLTIATDLSQLTSIKIYLRVQTSWSETIYSNTILLSDVSCEEIIPGFIYIVGYLEGWRGPYEGNEEHYANWRLFERTNEIGSNIYYGIFNVPQAYHNMFRFYTKLSGWDTDSWGYQVEDCCTDFENPSSYGSSYHLAKGKGAYSFPDWPGGVMSMVVDLNSGTLTIFPEDKSSEWPNLYIPHD